MVLSLPGAARRRSTHPKFKCLPVCHSWVALHPHPQGVIQFVGTTLGGTFPQFTYHHLLKSLFEAGYTIVALPVRFTLNHWSIALDLLGEHYAVRGAMVEAAVAQGYDPAVYLEAANYTWMGHGHGCKYLTLLELLSAPDLLSVRYPDLALQMQRVQSGLAALQPQVRTLETRIQQLTGQTVAYGRPSILGQASLLLAPVVTDLESAIPVKPLEQLFSQLLTVSPTVEQTHRLIKHSPLFHLTGLLQFARDRTAANTCQRLMQEQPHLRRRLLKGTHSEAIGFQVGACIVDLNPLDKFIQPLTHRDLESKALTFLHRLRHPSQTAARKSAAGSGRQRSLAA